MARPKKAVPEPKRPSPPAKTPEARETQLISLAIDMVEEQLLNKTASNQVLVHYLKLATTREELEKQKVAKEVELLKAKTDSIKSAESTEKLYSEALEAMRRYSGQKYDDYED